MKYVYELTIAHLPFRVSANIDIGNLIFNSEPYSLYINYDISIGLDTNLINLKVYEIEIINMLNKDITVSYKQKKIVVSGDLSSLFDTQHNRQFSLFGNKGIFNRVILHILESNHNSCAFHGCAVKHPETNKTLIGLGFSGSGKSVFVSNALKCGWKLVATECVIINNELEIFKGNTFDNVSPKAIEFIENNLHNAKIFYDKKLIEPIEQKTFISYSKYGIKNNYYTIIPSSHLSIIILNFGNSNMGIHSITDMDFLLRMLQITASEKIVFPLIFDDEILNTRLNGNPKIRTDIINKLLRHSTENIILGGNYQFFENYLSKSILC